MKSNFTILSNSPDVIVLEDLGPWDMYQTITNDAENVVAYLYKSGRLVLPTKQIVYFDSDGETAKLNHDGMGNFTGFGFTQRD
jgi:hypothetical protein